MTTDLTVMDTSTPAVVLKFDPNVMHHGGLGAIRSLGRLGVTVYGVHESRWAPAANSRYLQGRLFWRPDAEQCERTVAGLRALASTIGAPAVLIPTDDAGAIFLAEHAGALRGSYRFAEPPAGLPRLLAGKQSLSRLCAELGVPAPWAIVPATRREAREFGSATGYPVIAKLTAPWQAVGTGLRSTAILASENELDDLLTAVEQAGIGLMLQEMIPAAAGGDWFFHGYCDARSVCRPAFTGVKDRSYPAHAGLTSRGHAAGNKTLRAAVTDLLARVSYRGICDLDLRLDSRTGEYALLDFNPRLGAQFRVFRDRSGMDIVRAAYADLTGQPWGGAAEQQEGRAYLVENYDPLGALGYWRAGELGLRTWLESVRAVDEAAWFARDDLRPFGLMCLRMGWRAVSRPLTRPSCAGRNTGSEPRYRPGRLADSQGGKHV